MRIYCLSSRKLLFYHATLPDYADEIIESGLLKPSSELENHAGWNFSRTTEGYDYGDVVYLATTKESALYYAKLRLRGLWEEIEDIDNLYNEDMRFVGLFKIYIYNNSQNLQSSRKSGSPGEFVYKGRIPRTPNNEAFYIGPQWISVEDEANQYIQRREQIYKEFHENI